MVQFSKNDPKKKSKLPRSMQPVIPEPIHRIPPKGVTEGMSFRNLPGPSLTEIRKICKHYESKCSGDYRSLAYRYVLDMSKEIQGQIDGMEITDNQDRDHRHRIAHAPCVGVTRNAEKGGIKRDRLFFEETNASHTKAEMKDGMTSKWNDHSDSTISSIRDGERRTNHFDFSELDSRWNDNDRGETSRSIRQQHYQQQRSFYPDLTQIKKELVEKCDELREMKQNMDRELEMCKKEYKDRLEVERLLLKTTRDDLIRKHEKEIRTLKRETSQVKKDAKVVINFVRRKANEALVDEVEKSKYEKKQLTKELNKAETKLKRGFNKRLQTIGEDIKTVLQQKKYSGEKNSALPIPPSLNLPQHPIGSIDSIGETRSGSHRRIKFVPGSNESIPPLGSDGDSISTKEDVTDVNFTNAQNWFEKRINELDHWTDTLTETVQKGIQIRGGAGSVSPIKTRCRSVSPTRRRNNGIGKSPSPPPRRRNNHGIGKPPSPPPIKRMAARMNDNSRDNPNPVKIIW